MYMLMLHIIHVEIFVCCVRTVLLNIRKNELNYNLTKYCIETVLQFTEFTIFVIQTDEVLLFNLGYKNDFKILL
jgi:hypothetical protein